LHSTRRYDFGLLALSILVLVVWIYLTFFHGNFWRVGSVQLPKESATTRAVVAAIIPARNEADVISRAITSLLTQQFEGDLRLFVVDDNSTDGTANAARAAAGILGATNRVTVLNGAPLATGWTGKLWAIQQGWEAATQIKPDYFLLTDADIEHTLDNLARMMAQAEHGNLDLVSLMVKLRSDTLAEKFLIPAFVYFFFLLYPPARISNPRSRVGGAAGGCILIRSDALERADGFSAIRGDVIDDCALAARVKQAGGRIWLGVTNSTRSIRGYRTFANIRNMIARSAFHQLRHSALLLVLCFAGMLLTFVAPLVCVFAADRTAGWIGLAACVLMFTTYVPTLRLYRVNPFAALSLPLAAIFYLEATIVSAIRYWRGHGGEWKGRFADLEQSGSR
jgi:hopene-associated glycosyltransferase HpnB